MRSVDLVLQFRMRPQIAAQALLGRRVPHLVRRGGRRLSGCSPWRRNRAGSERQQDHRRWKSCHSVKTGEYVTEEVVARHERRRPCNRDVHYISTKRRKTSQCPADRRNKMIRRFQFTIAESNRVSYKYRPSRNDFYLFGAANEIRETEYGFAASGNH